MAAEGIGVFLLKMRKALGLKTVDAYTLNRLYVMGFKELADLLGYERAYRRLFEWGYAMGHSYLMRMETQLERFSVRVSDVRFLARAAWLQFSGSDPQVEVEERPAVGGSYIVIRLVDRTSPWAEGVEAGRMICAYPVGAYEGASNTFAILKGREYYCVCRETACLARGDDRCEFYTVYVPRETPRERVVQDFPELFEHLDMGFSEELYRRVFGE